jgi:hypothetical protein
VPDAVGYYKELSDVERRFRQLEAVLAVRPIYHQIELRVKAHIFVASQALLIQRFLERRLSEVGVDFSAERALEAPSTVHLVTLRLEGRDPRRGVNGGSRDARRVVKALKLSDLRPLEPPKEQETAM